MATKALVATGALALTGAAAYYLYGPAEDDDDADDLPTVTPSECVQIMEKITAIMTQQINTLMRKIQAQGAQIPQQMLQSYLIEHFETQLKEVQSVVFREFGKDEDEVEHACAYYEAKETRDDKVVEACNNLRSLYTNVGGRVELDLPEDLTVEKMCIIFEEYMAAVQAAQLAFSQHLQQLKARGAQVTTSQLNETRTNLMQNHVLTVLKKYDLTNLLWVAALEKYSDSQVFKETVERCKKGGAAP